MQDTTQNNSEARKSNSMMPHVPGNTVVNAGSSASSRTNLALPLGTSAVSSHHYHNHQPPQQNWIGHDSSSRRPPQYVPRDTNPAFAAIVSSENQLLLCTEIMPKDIGNESEDELDKEIQYLSKEILTLHTDNTTRTARTSKKSAATIFDKSKGKPSKSSNTTLSTKRKPASTKRGRDDDASNNSDDDSSDSDYSKKKRKKPSSTGVATGLSNVSAAAMKSMEAKRAKRKTQAKKRHARYDEDMELDLVRNSQNVCHSWENLHLGTVLGTPAYNEYLRKQLFSNNDRDNESHGGGVSCGICDHNERSVPQFTSEEVLHVIRNLRPPQTVPPPCPISSLGSNGEMRMGSRGWARRDNNADGGGDNMKTSAAAFRTYSMSSSDDDDDGGDENDMEVRAINGGGRHNLSLVVDDDSGSSDNNDEECLRHVTSSLGYDVAKLYETMCRQDADDWSCYRRYANNNLTSKGVIDKLRSLERNALFVDHEEERIMNIAQEIGLYQPGGRQMSEDVAFFMGYGEQQDEDLDI